MKKLPDHHSNRCSPYGASAAESLPRLNSRKRWAFTSLFLLLNFLYALPLLAQGDLPEASISKSGKIVLDASVPVSDSYQADISHFQFANEKAAEAFFSRLADGITTFTLDLPNKKVTLHLAVKMLANANKHWQVSDWNEYFSKKEQSLMQVGGQ